MHHLTALLPIQNLTVRFASRGSSSGNSFVLERLFRQFGGMLELEGFLSWKGAPPRPLLRPVRPSLTGPLLRFRGPQCRPFG